MKAKLVSESIFKGPSKEYIDELLKDPSSIKRILEETIQAQEVNVEFNWPEIIINGFIDMDPEGTDIPTEELEYVEKAFEYDFNANIQMDKNKIAFYSETVNKDIGNFYYTNEDMYKGDLKIYEDAFESVGEIINDMIEKDLNKLHNFIAEYFDEQDDIGI